MTDVPTAPGPEAQARYLGQVRAAIGAGDIARAGLVAEQALTEGGSDPRTSVRRCRRRPTTRAR